MSKTARMSETCSPSGRRWTAQERAGAILARHRIMRMDDLPSRAGRPEVCVCGWVGGNHSDHMAGALVAAGLVHCGGTGE